MNEFLNVTELDKQFRELDEQLALAFQSGVEGFVLAGKIVNKMIEEGDNLNAIALRCKIPAGIIRKIRNIGCNKLLPQLLIADFASAPKLRKLPLCEQRIALEKGIETVVVDDSGHLDVRILNPEDLSPVQVVQVFDGGSLRSISAQRALIESGRLDRFCTQSKGKSEATYRVRGQHIEVLKPCTFTAKELVRMLSEVQG